jgi:uncharacterized membrane protein YhdT
MSTASQNGKGGSGLRFRAWNLLLIIPLFTLITAIYNKQDPTFIGLPFFYWFQFVGIIVGVVCTSLVYLMTKDEPAPVATDAGLDVDDLDEGTAR